MKPDSYKKRDGRNVKYAFPKRKHRYFKYPISQYISEDSYNIIKLRYDLDSSYMNTMREISKLSGHTKHYVWNVCNNVDKYLDVVNLTISDIVNIQYENIDSLMSKIWKRSISSHYNLNIINTGEIE